MFFNIFEIQLYKMDKAAGKRVISLFWPAGSEFFYRMIIGDTQR